MIICHCTQTTDRDIRAHMRDGATTVEEVVERCGAGGCCGGCQPAIAEVVAEAAPMVTLEGLVSSTRQKAEWSATLRPAAPPTE